MIQNPLNNFAFENRLTDVLSSLSELYISAGPSIGTYSATFEYSFSEQETSTVVVVLTITPNGIKTRVTIDDTEHDQLNEFVLLNLISSFDQHH